MFLQRYLLNYLFMRDLTVIISLLRHRSVDIVISYHCNSPATCLEMQKMFNNNNFRMVSRKIDQNNNKILSQNHDSLGIIVYTSCKGWKDIFDSVDSKVFKRPLLWLIVTENLFQTLQILSQYKIELDSDVIVIVKHENVYLLYEVYHTGSNRNGQFVVHETGHWNGTLYIEQRDRKDLLGLVLKSTVVILLSQNLENKTFVKYLDELQPDLIKTDPVHKFKGYVTLKYFEDMFNTTFEFKQTESWGYHTNGTFDGLVGALQRLETDIGGSPLFIRADRMQAVDYVAETWQTKPSFIFRHPKRPGSWYSIYTRPLETSTWNCTISLMLVSAVLLATLFHVRWSQGRLSAGDGARSLAFLVVWSAVCQQGMTITRISNPAKIVIFSVFLFTITLYQYYTASVLSTLLQEQPKNIKTLNDLLKSDLNAGVEDILYNKDYFKRTADPIAREIYEKKVVASIPYNYFSAEQGLAMVKKGGFAFHVDSAVAYRNIRRTFSEKELCELQEVLAFAPYTSLAVAKNSPYKELLAYGVRKLSEPGLMSRLSSLWDERRPACVRTPDSSLISVGLEEFSAALAALALGAAASLLLLAAELLSVKIRSRYTAPFSL